MKKILKIILELIKILGMVLLILIFTSGIAFYYFLKKPEKVLRPDLLQRLARYAPLAGAYLTWEHLEVAVNSKGLLHKELGFDFKNLCISLISRKDNACIEHFSLGAELAFQNKQFHIISVFPLLLERGKINLYSNAAPNSKSEDAFNLKVPNLVLPDFLKVTTFSHIKIEWDEFNYWNEETSAPYFSGQMIITSHANETGHLDELNLQVSMNPSFESVQGDLKASLKSESHFFQNDWKLTVEAPLNLKQTTRLDFKLAMTPQENLEYQISLQAKAVKKKINAELDIDALLKTSEVKAKLTASVQGSTPQIQKVSTENCNLDLKKVQEKSDRMHLSVDCPLLVDITPLKLPSATFSKLVTLPYNFDFRVKGDIETSLYPSLEKPLSGHMNIALKTIEQDLLALDGTSDIQFAGIPSEYPKNWLLKTNLDLSLMLKQFQKLVKALNTTAFAVFAPLNPMDGSTEIKVKGEADIARNRGKLPLEFKTRLASKEQKLDSDGKGELIYELEKKNIKSKLNFELILSNLELKLPHLGLSSVPALLPDSRLITNEESKRKAHFSKSNLDYQINVKTPESNPAYLYSNFAKEKVPVSLDIQLTPQKMNGVIRLGGANLDFFRRNAHVEKFNLTLLEPREKSLIDALLKVSYAEYKISIIMVGTVKNPKIIFESDPPLDEEQIISVLVFGRPFENLNAEDTSSVSSVSAAAADRALALGSMFLLASTPIESVHYDPQSGTFGARLKLGNGSSLDLRTQEGRTQQIGFRKNIKGNLLIRSYFENDSEKSTQKGGAFLEWYKRY